MRIVPVWLLLAACTQDGTETPVVDDDQDGYAAGEDCDDADPSAHPGAVEICDGIDQNCDHSIEDEPKSLFFLDGDRDGYGDPGATVRACTQDLGVVANGADCDDDDPDVNPSAEETCDGVDSNCGGDGEEDAPNAPYWYLDSDGDSYGATSTRVKVCDPGDGYTKKSGDCDDADDGAHPGADELCNAVDDDCDDEVDEEDEVIDPAAWYPDGDGDGYGVPGDPVYGCVPPVGYGDGEADCDDVDASVHPDATETCDSLDQDCDGDIDEDAADGVSWYADADGDGWGDAAAVTVTCDGGGTGVTVSGDCADGDAAAHPGAAESCDGEDDDCDGAVDEDAIGATMWSADLDVDGFGDPTDQVTACDAPSGYVADATDCDDADADVFPGAPETCDGVDDDCDGDIDPAYVDADFDSANPLVLNGAAAWDTFGPGGRLELVSGAGEAGTAWYGVIPGTRFEASFAFQASGGTGGVGVGLVLLDSTDTSALGTGDVYGVGGLSGYAVAFDTANDLLVLVDTATGDTLDAVGTTALLGSGWHDVVVTLDGGAVDIQVDGSAALSATLAGYALTSQLVGVSAGTTDTAEAVHEVDDLWLGCP